MSWAEGFAKHYQAWSAHMTADIAFYVALARAAVGPLVELAIGNGRVALDLREGDLREGVLDEPAGLIDCPFRALLHLPTWADRRRTFERVAAALRPDGRFAWNAFAFDHQLAARLDGMPQTNPVPHTIRYAVGDNWVDITLEDGAQSSVRWATKNEWLGLLDVAGFEVEALDGGFAGEPFGAESREYVFVARRRSAGSLR